MSEEERIEYDEVDQADVDKLNADEPEAPQFHPILQVWREVLRPAEAEATAPITPLWANKITASYRELNFAQMPEFQKRFFGKISELAAFVDEVIASDDECLSYTTPEEDVENNSNHYKDLLEKWQVQVMRWEVNWDCTDEHAAVELAAISEVHKMFLGDQGLIPLLENIKFEYTDEDKAQLVEALNALKEG